MFVNHFRRLWAFKIIVHHVNTTITLQMFLIWGTLEIDWFQVKILANGKELKLSPIGAIPIIHKYKMKGLMNKPP